MNSSNEESVDVVVVGAGAAGLLAAARAAERGRRTLLLEKNRKPGVKILMSGGTRCNLTHATDAAGIVQAYGRPGRFLHSALAALSPRQLIELFHAEGVPTKVESTGKVFPVSDRALDVQRALLRRVARSGVELRVAQPVESIERHSDRFRLVTHDGVVLAKRLVLATGGCSYPGCGTTGDAYRWLDSLGHKVVSPRPALVPLISPANWVHALRGVTLPDLIVRIVPAAELPPIDDPTGRVAVSRRRGLQQRRGAMLLTHFGVSGPAVLDVSRSVTGQSDPSALALVCDLLPDQPLDTIAEDLHRKCQQAGGRSIAKVLPGTLPQRLGEALLELLGLPTDQKASEFGKLGRRRLTAALKTLEIPLQGSRGFAHAEVTAGGLDLREVDSRSMESKRVPGLFIVGELLDLDGPIGGYNFQAAFSTGWLAAEHV